MCNAAGQLLAPPLTARGRDSLTFPDRSNAGPLKNAPVFPVSSRHLPQCDRPPPGPDDPPNGTGVDVSSVKTRVLGQWGFGIGWKGKAWGSEGWAVVVGRWLSGGRGRMQQMHLLDLPDGDASCHLAGPGTGHVPESILASLESRRRASPLLDLPLLPCTVRRGGGGIAWRTGRGRSSNGACGALSRA